MMRRNGYLNQTKIWMVLRLLQRTVLMSLHLIKTMMMSRMMANSRRSQIEIELQKRLMGRLRGLIRPE